MEKLQKKINEDLEKQWILSHERVRVIKWKSLFIYKWSQVRGILQFIKKRKITSHERWLCLCACSWLACCLVGIFSVGWEDIYVMSARINLAENTSETNRDTCAQISPALSNKPLEGKAMLVNTEVIQK